MDGRLYVGGQQKSWSFQSLRLKVTSFIGVFCWCVIYMCTCWCWHVHIHVEARSRPQLSSSIAVHLPFWVWDQSSSICQSGMGVSSRNPLELQQSTYSYQSPGPGLWACPTMLSFYRNAGDPSSGPQACNAGPSSTKASPQPLVSFYLQKKALPIISQTERGSKHKNMRVVQFLTYE